MVEVIYCHESYDVKLIQHAIDDGAKGIILAGTGSGDTSSAADPYIANATAAGIPIVMLAFMQENCRAIARVLWLISGRDVFSAQLRSTWESRCPTLGRTRSRPAS